MTLDDFETRIARYGAVLGAWPGDERALAEALLARSAPARALLARQEALDLLFAAEDPLHAPSNLRERIAAAVEREAAAARIPARRPRRVRIAAFWPQLVGFAAASLIGFIMGTADPNLLPIDEQRTDLSAYIVGFESETLAAAMTEEP